VTRVTDTMLFASLLRGINRAQSQLLRRSEQATTGLKVVRPSDDPTTASRGLALAAALERLESMDHTGARATGELGVSETALGSASDILARIRDIAAAGGTDAYSAADRQTMAAEVEGLRQSLVAAANTQAGDTYVFGGFATTVAPFLADGTFIGDANVRTAEIAPGMQVATSGSGAAAFTAAGGQDLFALLAGLRNDLLANDPVAIRGRLSNLEQAQTQLRTEQLHVGISQQQVENAAQLRTFLTKDLVDSLQAAVQVETTTAAVELTQAQTVLQAAIAASAQVMSALRDSLKL
jgi:flagellar hook-associated protein 3 FlgL